MKAILQARMTSARLPGKVLMEAAGQPLLAHNVHRIQRARLIDEVIVATSDRPEDDAIVSLCASLGVHVFRGSELDVLDRIVGCARHFGLSAFCKLTGDNPMIDPELCDSVIELFASGEWDFASNNHPPSWPQGQILEVMTLAALEEAWAEAREPFQREHVTPFLWDQPHRYKIANLLRTGEDLYKTHRWTLDYPEDYQFMRIIFDRLGPDFSMDEVLTLLAAEPHLQQINQMHAGEVWYTAHRDSLNSI